MKGLTTSEALKYLERDGPNILPVKKGYSSIKIFISQLKNPFSVILALALVFSFVIGDKLDAGLILLILVLNTTLGFWQEFKASKELEALKSFEVLYTRVLRDGKEVKLPASELVVNDVVILEAGDKIPADGVIFEVFALQVNESILTGESLPVIKTEKNEENKVFFGTNVVSGRAKFEVTQTGANTRFGKIAQTLSEVEDDQTPLEKSLSKMIKGIGIVVVLVILLLSILRLLSGAVLSEVLISGIAMIVAAVPEGLPTVVTIILALGVRRMLKKKALVRKMIAVESLGGATIILSDKTGTLTKNEMRVKKVKDAGDLDELYNCAVLCSSATLVLKEDSIGFDVLGDTTEGAMLLWAQDSGRVIEEMRAEGKLIEEKPFNLQSRKMSVVWENRGKRTLYVKGAPEAILKDVDLTEEEKESWEREYQLMAKTGLRVLALAKNKKMLGLIGIADEIRSEAREAIKIARNAGIKVVMVTGDNELTAKSIAEELGMLSEGDEVLTGSQLNELSDEALRQLRTQVKVFARIPLADRSQLLKFYQSLGEVVAVTGDGVNDSLALKQSQVGVSMGKVGTDVAKEASDIILLDDNFATLINAVEEGRLIYANIIKVIKFLLTGNFSEILLISLAALLSLPSPLLPTQILWINFVSDGLPALALGFDGGSPHIMKIPPRKNSNILDSSMIKYVALGGGLIGVICLSVFYFIYQNQSLQEARAWVFTVMVILQMILPFIIRRHNSFVSNKRLLGAVTLMLIFQYLILTIPELKALFGI